MRLPSMITSSSMNDHHVPLKTSTTVNAHQKLIDQLIMQNIVDNNNNESNSEQKFNMINKIQNKRKYAKTLSQLERQIIHNLQMAINDTFVDERTLTLVIDGEEQMMTNKNTSFFLDMIPKLYLNRITKFCFKIEPFQNLPHSDQLIILKRFFHEIFILRSVFMFDREKQGFPIIKVLLF